MSDKLLQEILKVLKSRPDKSLKDIVAATMGARKMHDALEVLTLGALLCPDDLRETVGEMLEAVHNSKTVEGHEGCRINVLSVAIIKAIKEELKFPMSLDCEKEHGHGLN